MKGMIEGNVYVTPRTHFFVYPPPTTHEHEDLDRRDETRRQLLMVMLDVGGFCWRKCKILFSYLFFCDGPTCEVFSFAPLFRLITPLL
jgi:hypothetical protein